MATINDRSPDNKQDILIHLASRQLDHVVTLLEENTDLEESFRHFHEIPKENDLKRSLQQQLSDLQVIKWILHFPDINVNEDFDIAVRREYGVVPDAYRSTALEQMFVTGFSMESILHLRRDKRLTPEVLFIATLRRDVPSDYNYHNNASTGRAFCDYVQKYVKGDSAEEFLKEYLTGIDVNIPSPALRNMHENDDTEETLLMIALNVLAYAEKSSPGLVFLVHFLLTDPGLDINRKDSHGLPIAYRLVHATNRYSDDKRSVLEKILNRKDIDINTSTAHGTNIVMYFINRFFSDNDFKQPFVTVDKVYSPAKMLTTLVRYTNLSREIQEKNLQSFFKHPQFKIICENISIEDYAIHNIHSAVGLASIIKLLLGSFDGDTMRLQSAVKTISSLMTKIGVEPSKNEFISAIVEDMLNSESHCEYFNWSATPQETGKEDDDLHEQKWTSQECNKIPSHEEKRQDAIQKAFLSYLRKETNDLVAILLLNEDLKTSFIRFHNLNESTNLYLSFDSLSDTAMIQWFLNLPEVDVNHIYKSRSVYNVGTTLLEEMLLRLCSMESVLLMRRDSHLSTKTHHRATTGIGEYLPKQSTFIDYVQTCVKGEFAEQFLDEYLTGFPMNQLNFVSKPSDCRAGHETLLMAALGVLSDKTSVNQGLSLLIRFLLNLSDLDINIMDDEGHPAIFRLVKQPFRCSDERLRILEEVLKRSDVDVNITSAEGINLLTYFTEQFYNSARWYNPPHCGNCSDVPKILKCLVQRTDLSESMQSKSLQNFIQHPKLREICQCLREYDTDIGNNPLASCLISIVRILLGLEKVDVNAKSLVKKTTVFMTVIGMETNKEEVIDTIVGELLSMDVLDINAKDRQGRTALVHAIRSNNPNRVKQVMAMQHCDIRLKDAKGRTPVMHALELPESQSKASILAQLTRHQDTESLNLQNEEGNSILHILFQNKEFESIQRGLENLKRQTNGEPLDIDIKNNEHEALYSSMINIRKSCSEVQESSHIDEIFNTMLSLPNGIAKKRLKHNRTLLHVCILEDVQTFTDSLLDVPDIDINAQDDTGSTPLMYAVSRSNTITVEKLLLNPLCEVAVKNKQGEDIQDLVRRQDMPDQSIRTLVTVVYTRTTLKTEHTMLTNVSFDDQLKFLITSVKRQSALAPWVQNDIACQLQCIQSDIAVQTGGRYGSEFTMAEEHRRKLLGLRSFLCEEVMPRELLVHLISDGILTEDMVEDIENQHTRRRMCEKLLSILPLRGERAFQSFIDALNKEKQEHVVRHILAFDPDTAQPQNMPQFQAQAAPMAMPGYGMLPYPYGPYNAMGVMGPPMHPMVPPALMPQFPYPWPSHPPPSSNVMDRSQEHMFDKQ